MKQKKTKLIEGLNIIWRLSNKKEKSKLIFYAFANVISGFTEIIPTLILSIIINTVMGVPSKIFGIALSGNISIWVIIAVGFVISSAGMIMNTFLNNSQSVFALKIQQRLQQTAFNWVLIPRKNMDIQLTSGDAAHRIKEASHAIMDVFDYIFQYLLPMMFASAFSFIYLITIDVIAIPVIIVASFLITLAVGWRTKHQKAISLNDEKFASKVSNNIINVLSNLFVVNLFKSQKHEVENLKKIDADRLQNTKKDRRNRALYWSIIALIEFGAIFTLIAISVKKTLNGIIDIGNIVLIFNYSFQIFNPLTQMGWIFTELFVSTIKLNRVNELEPELDKIIDTSKDVEISERFSSIEMKNVSVKNSETSTVSNINMTFNRGEITVVGGRSGRGKTTAIRALTGLAEREEGEIIINGKYSINTMQSYLDRVSVTMQSPYIFNRDISENIFYPDIESCDYAEELFEKLNMKNLAQRAYNSELEQNLENQLSGGEKKRICVSRGIIKPAEVYIFDEPTNELDNDNTQKIINELNRLKENAIVIVVTHDARISLIADKIIAM